MKSHRNLLPVLLMAAILVVLTAGAAYAQTPDGETPAEETVCDLESGAAFGLCNAYCEAMDCHLPDAEHPDAFPKASATACHRIWDHFVKIKGEPPPCECPPEAGQMACPCEEDLDCADELSCDPVTGTCMEVDCPAGTEGCPCDSMGQCYPGLFCDTENSNPPICVSEGPS